MTRTAPGGHSATLKLVRRFHSAASIAPSTRAEQSRHSRRSVFDSSGDGGSDLSSTAITKRAGRRSPLRWQSSHCTHSGARLNEMRFLNIERSTIVFSLVEWRSALSCGGKCRRPAGSVNRRATLTLPAAYGVPRRTIGKTKLRYSCPRTAARRRNPRCPRATSQRRCGSDLSRKKALFHIAGDGGNGWERSRSPGEIAGRGTTASPACDG